MEFNSEKDIMIWADQRMLIEYDDLIRKVRRICESDIAESFLNFVEYHKRCRDYWIGSATECKRLQAELEKTIVINTDLESKIVHARRLLENERKLRRECESEIDILDRNMGLARELLFNDKKNKLANETLEKLQFLNNNATRTKHRLSTITELNTTGSILSDMSLSRSEDDLDLPDWQRHRSSINNDESLRKRRRKSSDRIVEINANDRVVATTTLSVGKDGGPITATSIIEAVPEETPKKLKPSAPPQELLENIEIDSDLKKGKSTPQYKFRQHAFSSKPIIRPEKCSVCELRIGFGKVAVKCRHCPAVTHVNCQHLLSLSCVPVGNTPTVKGGGMGVLGDYAPSCPPMIPSLIVHCINEVEHRGLNEVGLYRIPGSEREVKLLKENFLRGKRVPNLSGIEIPVICGVIKDFLRSLKEPILTTALWSDFIRAVESNDKRDIEPVLYQIISELPTPNRDTLAYIMLHLQKVAERHECKMPISNLAKIFGPTIVGYSNTDVDIADMLSECRQQASVVEHLLKLPSSYWESLITLGTNTPSNKGELKQTFSTESLGKHFGGYFTPSSSVKKQKRKFFETPPKNK